MSFLGFLAPKMLCMVHNIVIFQIVNMRPFSDIFFQCGFEYRLGSALFATVERQARAKRISHLSWEKVKLYIKPFSGARLTQCIILPRKYIKKCERSEHFSTLSIAQKRTRSLPKINNAQNAPVKNRGRAFLKAHAQITKDKQSSTIEPFLGWKTLCLPYELQLSRFIVLMPLLRDLLAL